MKHNFVSDRDANEYSELNIFARDYIKVFLNTCENVMEHVSKTNTNKRAP